MGNQQNKQHAGGNVDTSQVNTEDASGRICKNTYRGCLWGKAGESVSFSRCALTVPGFSGHVHG